MQNETRKGGWKLELAGGSPAVAAFKAECDQARRERLAPYKDEIDAYFARQIYVTTTGLEGIAAV